MIARWLCLRCAEVAEVEVDETGRSVQSFDGCPACHHHGIPADLTNDSVTVDLTWHELRVLVIWAEFWAGVDRGDPASKYDMQRAVTGIADRLHRQHLEKPPLTFTGEIAQLSAEFGHVEVHGIDLLPHDEPT